MGFIRKNFKFGFLVIGKTWVVTAGLPFLSWEMKSGPAATSSWWRWGGGGMVPAMAATGEVDRGAPVDRVEARDGGAARPAMGCGMVQEDRCMRKGHAHNGGRGRLAADA